ncbi:MULTISPECIES: DUF4181 domain-containing protein [Cytobacillus]|uniref:DUF4181 domain-containing protein n=2 Tax=Cytobacillus TaxID=2675230 RepID=A0ABX3CPV9_9BACI|nr:DUF4181 domain-containing protein [Cytobacillus oceanisediminis]EFV75544.1 hypothetical protein HMPREF1013_04322 [Bacillus sp. 2_A_57_CT2]OHX46303.1 hypothetical protein BBV17_22660 [Cytobacillus oceanisediminis]USK45165.1 DUF4181 domain-containing protein [Cytobacillus oceanisediminis]
MYVIDPMFWPKLLLLITIVGVLIYSFELGLRKWLKVEKKKFFSYNHINDKHKKVDWTIRIGFLVTLLTGYVINMKRYPMEFIWYLEPAVLLIVFIVLSETARAFMEWKFAENRKAYLVTIFHLAFVLFLLFIVIKTDFFWML